MSIESFAPIPLDTFGGWITLLDPSDVPVRHVSESRRRRFFPGGVRTRPGLVWLFFRVGGGPSQINGLKTYITTNLVQRLIVSRFKRQSLQKKPFTWHTSSPSLPRGVSRPNIVSRLDNTIWPGIYGFCRCASLGQDHALVSSTIPILIA